MARKQFHNDLVGRTCYLNDEGKACAERWREIGVAQAELPLEALSASDGGVITGAFREGDTTMAIVLLRGGPRPGHVVELEPRWLVICDVGEEQPPTPVQQVGPERRRELLQVATAVFAARTANAGEETAERIMASAVSAYRDAVILIGLLEGEEGK